MWARIGRGNLIPHMVTQKTMHLCVVFDEVVSYFVAVDILQECPCIVLHEVRGATLDVAHALEDDFFRYALQLVFECVGLQFVVR